MGKEGWRAQQQRGICKCRWQLCKLETINFQEVLKKLESLGLGSARGHGSQELCSAAERVWPQESWVRPCLATLLCSGGSAIQSAVRARGLSLLNSRADSSRQANLLWGASDHHRQSLGDQSLSPASNLSLRTWVCMTSLWKRQGTHAWGQRAAQAHGMNQSRVPGSVWIFCSIDGILGPSLLVRLWAGLPH